MCENNSTLQPVPLSEPMQTESIGELALALSKAQGNLLAAVKDKKGYNYKYADLKSVWGSCRKPLNDNKLAVFQTTNTDIQNDCEVIITLLAHSSGEWVKGILRVPLTKQEKIKTGKDQYHFITIPLDIQDRGAVITYGRRYALMAIIGIAPEDDDCQKVVDRDTGTQKQATQAQKPTAPSNNKQKSSENSSSEATATKPPLPEGKLKEIVGKIDKAEAIDHLERISAKHIEPYSLTKEQHKLLGGQYADRKKEIKAELKQLKDYKQQIVKNVALIEKIMGETYIVKVIDKHVSKILEIDSVTKATIPKHLRTGKLSDLVGIINNELEKAKLREQKQ